MTRPERLTPVLLRAGMAAVLVGTVAAVRPNLVRSAATNPRAWALTLVLVALAVGLPVLARRLGASPSVASGVGLAPAAIALAVVLVPSFTTTTLNEPLPEAFRSTPSAGLAESARDVSATPSPSPASAASSSAPAAPSPAPAPAAPSPAAPAPAAPAPAPAPAPAADPSGSLKPIDHGPRGTVTVVSAGGERLLRFVDIEPAPDHQVHLVPGGGKRSPGAGSVHLGSLKAEKGSFSYPVPAGFDTGEPFTVLLWCGRFASPNGHATLA